MVRMVDVSEKHEVLRRASARGCIKLRRETMDRIKHGNVEKGDVITVSSIVAMNAVKRTWELLPFCHPIRIDHIDTRIELHEDELCIEVSVKARDRTGVEMEALMGVAMALLNVWDMVKKYEKDERGQYPYTEIRSIRVVEKVKEEL